MQYSQSLNGAHVCLFVCFCICFLMIWTWVHADRVAFLIDLTPLCLLTSVLLIMIFCTIIMKKKEKDSGEYYNPHHALGRMEIQADCDFLQVIFVKTQNWNFWPLPLAYNFTSRRLRKAFNSWRISNMVFAQNRMSSEEGWKMFLFIAFKTLVYKHLYLINFSLNYSSD